MKTKLLTITMTAALMLTAMMKVQAQNFEGPCLPSAHGLNGHQSAFCGFTQTIALSEDWNWVSLYVEGNPIEMLMQLEAALGDNGMQIESQYDGVTENIGDGYWWGDLDEVGIDGKNMYLIQAAADCEVELQGEVADLSSREITLYPEWNWIGFPSSEEVDIVVALSGLEAEDGDMIEAQDGVAEYLGDGYWWGIETLVPGQGYMYYSNSSDVKTFFFQTVVPDKAASTITNLGKLSEKPIMVIREQVKVK
jgi:hypothetical protein